MSSQKKQLGIEHLEERLNQSAFPTGMGWASSFYAVVRAHNAATKGPIKPALRTTPVSKTPGKPAPKITAKPVVKTPAKSITKAKPSTTTPTVTPAVATSTKSTTSTTSTSTPATTAPQSTSNPSTPPSVPAITADTPPATTPATVPATAPATMSTVADARSPSTSANPSISSSAVLASNATADPLAPILAQLYGDDVHDDSGTIQQLIDTAYADGIKNVTLPAGTFLLDKQISVYGDGVTFAGQGASTILDVNHFYTGIDSSGKTGIGVSVRAVFDSTPLMIAQPVTGKTIVFRGNVNLAVGQSLYLSDGLGSTAIIESQLHGAATQADEFRELGPSEYVQIASVAQSGGNTVVTLTSNVIGLPSEYANVAPAGVTSVNYLHASTIQTATSNITLQNFAVEFKEKWADEAIIGKFTNHLTINGVHILNAPQFGGAGGIALISSTNGLIENVTGANPIGLNSARASTVTNCNVTQISLEESCTDDLITRNTLTGTTSCDLRINDMACMRNTFSYNDVHGGAFNSGAIAIAEGTDTTIANNTVHGGAAVIWLGITSGTKVINNIADGFGNYQPIGTTIVTGNSFAGG